MTSRSRKRTDKRVEMQPCWTCKNYVDGCNWSRSRGNIPVEGWIAIPTIKQGGVKSYKIIYCPEYDKE